MTAIVMATGCSSAQMESMKKTMDEVGRDYGTAVLCGVGTIAGAGVGYAVNGERGAYIGAAAGAAAGCYAGHMWQSRMQELDKIAKEENLKLTMQTLELAGATPSAAPVEAGLVAQIEDSGMFDSGSAQLTPSGMQAAKKLAAVYAGGKQAPNRRLLVVGHTDATGSSKYNQSLSEARAKALGKILVSSGVPVDVIYYQGAGASRPIADNATAFGRDRNRRVEIVELTSEDMLVKRAMAEESNAKYLTYGASTKPAPVAPAKPSTSKPTVPKTAEPKVEEVVAKAPPAPLTIQSAPKPSTVKPTVDFAGVPATEKDWQLVQGISPKSGGFAIMSKAQASDIPMSACIADMPRQSGQVLSLATDKPLNAHSTLDYLPGYNNRVWANTVNGHLVTISPVSILKDNAQVDRQPIVQLVPNYDEKNRKALPSMKTVANAYEGETQILYRVFAQDPKSPVTCMDVVFSKGNAKAERGALFYPVSDDFYTAAYTPISTK